MRQLKIIEGNVISAVREFANSINSGSKIVADMSALLLTNRSCWTVACSGPTAQTLNVLFWVHSRQNLGKAQRSASVARARYPGTGEEGGYADLGWTRPLADFRKMVRNGS